MASLPLPSRLRRSSAALPMGVVTLELPDGVGGGVLLITSGLIATNFQLMEAWSTVRVCFRDQSSATAVVCRSYRDIDIALVPSGCRGTRLGRADPARLRKGQRPPGGAAPGEAALLLRLRGGLTGGALLRPVRRPDRPGGCDCRTRRRGQGSGAGLRLVDPGGQRRADDLDPVQRCAR